MGIPCFLSAKPMYPLQDCSLSLADIAKHWSRAIEPRMPERELHPRFRRG
jgi:hypothetical protein